MKSQVILLPVGLASAGLLPSHEQLHARQQARGHGLHAREVPREHAQNFVVDLARTALNIDNPLEIQDPIFALLGDAAAAAGAGKVTNLACLQQEVADQAFTNSKAAGDLPGMAGALMFRTIERNTGKVGLASELCDETATNPEIAALTQHQDPASENADSINKDIEIALAQQLAAIGADPMLALESGTFAAGDVNDPTGAGNSCDTEDDDPGCMYSLRLLVPAANADDIASAVEGITATITGTGVLSATHIDFAGLTAVNGAAVIGGDNAAAAAAAATTPAAAAAADGAVAAGGGATATAGAAKDSACTANAAAAAAVTPADLATPTAGGGANAAGGVNIQKFTGTLGIAAPPVVSSANERPFAVGGDTFLKAAAALQRSCDQQNNACFNAANSGALAGGTAQCQQQKAECDSQAATVAKLRARMMRGRWAPSRRQAAGDFGSCANPAISFSSNLPDRQGSGFIADDQGDFPHGSALNVAVIAGFVCQRLGDTCKAGAAVVSQCSSASAAAVATTQNQAAADAFNQVLGVSGGGGGVAAAAATPTGCA